MFSLNRTSCWLICWHVNWRIIKSHVENILQNLQLLNKNNPYYRAFTQLLRSCRGTITFMKQYKTWKPNQNLAYIIFLYSKSQSHFAIKCQHSPSSSSRDKFCIYISNSSHDSDKTLSMYSKGRYTKTSSISSIFDDFLGFRAHLQVFERFCTFSSRDFTVPQINATARTNDGWGTVEESGTW
jgi:hypothetical protein